MPKRLVPAAALLVILTGCAQATSNPDSSVATPPASSPTPTRPATAADGSQISSADLQLWLPVELSPRGSRPEAEILARQLDDFTAEYASVTVEVTEKEAEGEAGLLSFLLSAQAVAPSILPDLAILHSDDLRAAFEAGLLQPLGGLLSQDRLDDQFKIAAELATIGEEQAGFVFGAEILHGAYRPALVATPPVSWTQVTSGRISYLFPAGGQSGLVDDATLLQYLAASDEPAGPDGGWALDGDALESVLGFYRSAVARGAVSPATVLAIADLDEAWERFAGGEGALSVVRSRRYWLEADDTMAPCQLPTADSSPVTLGRGWVIILIAQSPQRQPAALALIEALTEPEAQAAWTRAAGYLPATNEALEMWTDSSEERSVLRALLESARPRPELPASIAQAMQEALEAVLRGEATPKQAVTIALDSLEQ